MDSIAKKSRLAEVINPIAEDINLILDLASGPIYEPQPVDDELYSRPFTVPRSHLSIGGQLAVPDASCVIVWGYRGFCHVFAPGVHSLRNCPPGRLSGRLVDTSQRNLKINLSDIYTIDLARLSLQINVEFKVANPEAVIQIKSPLQTLIQLVEGTTRQVIKDQSHDDLFLSVNSTQLTDKTNLERQIRQSLHIEPALEGLRMVSIKIVKIEGDPTHLKHTTTRTLAKQQLLAEEATLSVRRQLADSQRKLVMFEIETERLATSARAETALDDAERQASIFKLELAHREFQREMEEMRLAQEQSLARIEALGQAVVALGDPRNMIVSNAAYAHSPNLNGREEALTQIIDSLTEPQKTWVPASSNSRNQSASSFEE
jgi:hypothetical protein